MLNFIKKKIFNIILQKLSYMFCFLIKKRLYFVFRSLDFYLITNFKCFGGLKWPLNVRKKR